MADYQSRILVHKEGIDTSRFTSVNNLTTAFMDRPDQLSPKITQLFGDFENNAAKFPFLQLTEGSGRIGKAAIRSSFYEYPVIGRRKETDVVHSTSYTSESVIGAGADVVINFKTQWFVRQKQIISPSGVMCRIQTDGQGSESSGFRYVLKTITPGAVIPYKDVKPGAVWGYAGPALVSTYDSEGSYGRVQTPGKRKGTLNVLRMSYGIAGNIGSKIVEFKLKNAKGQETSKWLDWYEYVNWLQFKVDRHLNLFTSEYSFSADGTNHLTDDASNATVPSGAGLKQQITQQFLYSSLTVNMIDTVIGDIFRGKSDNGVNVIGCFCGSGFKDEFHKAMVNSGVFQLIAPNATQMFLKENTNGLTLGNYITAYKHIEGHVMMMINLPFLEKGGYADSKPRHVRNNRSKASYEAYFVDMGSYDNQPNLMLLHEEGRPEVKGIEQGMAWAGGMAGLSYTGNREFLSLATGKDRTAIHFLCTQGLAMLNDTYSFKFLPTDDNFEY
jgi:hypothetical protein